MLYCGTICQIVLLPGDNLSCIRRPVKREQKVVEDVAAEHALTAGRARYRVYPVKYQWAKMDRHGIAVNLLAIAQHPAHPDGVLIGRSDRL